MARILPAEPLPGTSPAEIKVLQALRRLPEAWVVLHSVAWQSLRDGRQGDGEADVLAINPEVGVVVIEVKGGGVGRHAGWR